MTSRSPNEGTARVNRLVPSIIILEDGQGSDRWWVLHTGAGSPYTGTRIVLLRHVHKCVGNLVVSHMAVIMLTNDLLLAFISQSGLC